MMQIMSEKTICEAIDMMTADKRRESIKEAGAKLRHTLQHEYSGTLEETEICRNYDFVINSKNTINIYEIAEDLSRKNPIIIVQHSNRKEGMILLHISLGIKAEICSLLPISVNMKYEKFFYTIKVGNLKTSKWIKWAQKVKAAKWKEKKTETVHVIIPKV
jgi:hypothetical protein